MLWEYMTLSSGIHTFQDYINLCDDACAGGPYHDDPAWTGALFTDWLN